MLALVASRTALLASLPNTSRHQPNSFRGCLQHPIVTAGRRIFSLAAPVVVSAACLLLATKSHAGTIFASGHNVTPANGARDLHWEIVAIPTVVDRPPPDAVPYAAYVASAVPTAWLGGDANTGGGGGKWITPNFGNGAVAPSFPVTPTSSAFPFGNWQPYSWVARQEFTIEADGIYTFDFYGTGDDFMKFFVNGTVQNVPPAGYDSLASRFPSIVGGTQILSTKPNEVVNPLGSPFGPDGQPAYDTGVGTSGDGDFGELTRFTGDIFLTAGTHNAYMVLFDQGGDSGALIGTSTFVPVPEPSTYVLLSLAVTACAGLCRYRRRRNAA